MKTSASKAPPLLHVSDKDATCQTILGMYEENSIAEHIFGDINDRLPKELREKLDRLEPQAGASATAQMEAYHFMRTELSDFFSKFGRLTDSVVMMDRQTQRPGVHDPRGVCLQVAASVADASSWKAHILTFDFLWSTAFCML